MLAEQSKLIFLTLYNDLKLKDLMDIPTIDKNNVVKIRDNYIISTFNTDALIISETSRILFRNTNLIETNNFMVKRDSIIFDIYVKNSEEFTTDPVDRLLRRQLLIAERIYELLAYKTIGNMKFYFADKGDLMSNTQNYKRYFIRFDYKIVH